MKKALLYLAFLSAITVCSQTQIGSIRGVAEGDEFGFSISLSANGNIVAIGANKNDANGDNSGQVRIYKNNSGVWTQIGNDINGESEKNYSGTSVSLSSEGNIVAIGAPWNDGNGDFSGHVRIYENINEQWTQIGNDIDGETKTDKSGTSVSLSADGSTIAIGAPYNSAYNNGYYYGQVRVYKKTDGNWIQVGNDIDAEAIGDAAGTSISLSSNGEIVAIGAPQNNGSANKSGHVRIYQIVNDNWVQLGNDINGEAAIDNSGSSVSLSSNGRTVAIGAKYNSEKATYSGHVRIYRDNVGSWVQIGNDIDGDAAQDFFGTSVSISSNGTIVAIGAPNSNRASGLVKIYKNTAGVWTQVGTDLKGEKTGDIFGSSVSLSDDGNILAIGAPGYWGNGDRSGKIYVYDLSSSLKTETNELKHNFTIYPNPTSNSLQLQFDSRIDFNKARIYNFLGQLILQSNSKTINTSKLSTGVYFLEVETNKGKGLKKFIKK